MSQDDIFKANQPLSPSKGRAAFNNESKIQGLSTETSSAIDTTLDMSSYENVNPQELTSSENFESHMSGTTNESNITEKNIDESDLAIADINLTANEQLVTAPLHIPTGALMEPAIKEVTTTQFPGGRGESAGGNEDTPLLPTPKLAAQSPVYSEKAITVGAEIETKQDDRVARINKDTSIVSDDIDIKLAEQPAIDSRHLGHEKLATDERLKVSAIFGSKAASSPAMLTLLPSAEATSFALTASAPSPLSVAPTQTISPLAPTLNAPSLTSVMQSIIRTVETQKGVSVRLDPPEMGRVYIDYQFEEGRSVTAVIRADLPEALAQLRDNSTLLQSLLKENGFDQVNINFEQNTSDNDASNSQEFQNMTMPLNSETAIETPILSQIITPPPHRRGQFSNQSIDIKL